MAEGPSRSAALRLHTGLAGPDPGLPRQHPSPVFDAPWKNWSLGLTWRPAPTTCGGHHFEKGQRSNNTISSTFPAPVEVCRLPGSHNEQLTAARKCRYGGTGGTQLPRTPSQPRCVCPLPLPCPNSYRNPGWPNCSPLWTLGSPHWLPSPTSRLCQPHFLPPHPHISRDATSPP